MATKIEELRRLKETCERRARLMAALHHHLAAERMERQAREIGWQIQGELAQAELAAFAARVEE